MYKCFANEVKVWIRWQQEFESTMNLEISQYQLTKSVHKAKREFYSARSFYTDNIVSIMIGNKSGIDPEKVQMWT